MKRISILILHSKLFDKIYFFQTTFLLQFSKDQNIYFLSICVAISIWKTIINYSLLGEKSNNCIRHTTSSHKWHLLVSFLYWFIQGVPKSICSWILRFCYASFSLYINRQFCFTNFFKINQKSVVTISI